MQTVQGLITRGEGGKGLRKQVRQVLGEFLRNTESVELLEESVNYRLADQPAASESIAQELILWKRRAKEAEIKLENLRAAMRSLLELSSQSQSAPVNSKPLSEAQRIAARASASTGSDPTK